MKILLTGGGTLGPVSPLLALYEEAHETHPDWEWFWVGTKSGIEKEVVSTLKGITYEWIPSAKLRRYFSVRTAIEPIIFIFAFLRSLLIILTMKPDVVIGAGGFVSVPVMWAAWLFRKRIIIHQQDIRPTLSNKLTAWTATTITTTFEKSLEDYPKHKTHWIGNPMRNAVMRAHKDIAYKKFKLDPKRPVLLITGGSSGAQAINEWVWHHMPELCDIAQVVHLTGKDNTNDEKQHEGYYQIEFLHGEFFHLLSASDLVITRAGIGTLTELAYLRKACFIIPMQDTHQEDNAFYIAAHRAARVYRQDQLDQRLLDDIALLIRDTTERDALAEQLHILVRPDARQTMVKMIEHKDYIPEEVEE